MKLSTFIMLVLLSWESFGASAGVRNDDGSFSLSEKALKLLGVNFKTLQSDGPWEVPKSSLVKIKFTQGVYRRFEHTITYVIVKVLKENEHTLIIAAPDLQARDEIAVSAVTYLRLAEADLNSTTVDNCSH